MNIYELLNENQGINITINAGQLIECIDYCVQKTKKELEQQITDANTETYPSPKKVCEILDINLSTLWRWHQRKYLCHIEIGGKRRYLMSEVDAILKGKGRDNV